MYEFLKAVKAEAKRKGLDPHLVMCLLQGIGGICDGTNCVALEVTEPMDPDTRKQTGQANLDKFYNKLETRQNLLQR
ncbi:MAG: hypothetical protein ABII21_00615 [bacterium]